ncbi:LysR family transcriptional regulator [Pseudomonas rhizosphaerae]|jgi:LysR family glycine cleavage system transcriptional activator|uniref:LysR family transcriptional regulator n=1 Tax=Pseudomonas rhizosphaerae TaxID=216142 RepID=A0A089YNL7_9PSED|nr:MULTISPECIES: LysR substrate-binding domain-containing protein [Pseudomonas]AIS17184.1 LysR family transcriptional regulator [Pseudomonas rhizosphaerae]MDY1045240.1 LysR substrate-binding domain-containing protein [Pseudomonas coleopterorum]
MKLQPMPPLNSLVAFEAAARHLSFTLAARELNVTQGAISRQIRLLEDYLGKPLFSRTTREIVLTTVGKQYCDVVRESLQQVAHATSGIRHWQGSQRVTVVTSTAMASLWLLPRVSVFKNLNDEVDLRIIATDNMGDFSKLDCDLALYYCRSQPTNARVTPLFVEEIFPVCSPAYLARNPQLSDPQHLGEATWLWLEDPQSDWVGWAEWFLRNGLPPTEPRNRIDINSYSMLIQSALAGQGVALAWSNLVDSHLLNGALVRPVETVLRTDARFCLLEPSGRSANRQSVNRFREWLLTQVSYVQVADVG